MFALNQERPSYFYFRRKPNKISNMRMLPEAYLISSTGLVTYFCHWFIGIWFLNKCAQKPNQTQSTDRKLTARHLNRDSDFFQRHDRF